MLFILPSVVFAQDLKPFTTDGCSVFPDGNIKHHSLWVNCCIRHDLAYWKGGTYDERNLADQTLKLCVANVGQSKIAAIMMAGVRVGGTPYLPTSYRWGYGWPFFRGYKSLTDDEKIEVKNKLELFKMMINRLSEELQ